MALGIRVDPSRPFFKYTEQFGELGEYTFLDYDGFREGDFQTSAGWYVPKANFLAWQRQTLGELGFLENEIDDVNSSYGRGLLEAGYPQSHFAVYPQQGSTLDASVSLTVTPKPDYVYRLWLYIVPTNHSPSLTPPNLPPIVRRGFTVIELGDLTDQDIPSELRPHVDGRRLVRARHRFALT
jgi:hypothetical protein